MLTDPYTFTEFEDALHGIVDGPFCPKTFEFSSIGDVADVSATASCRAR